MLGIVGIAAGIEFLIHHYDPTRIVYKRLKADDKYVYDEIHPRFLATDPRNLLAIHSAADADQKRRDLIRAIWGDDRLSRDVVLVPASKIDARSGGIEDGTAVEEYLQIQMDHGLASVALHLKPRRHNGRMIIYHHGYAGTFEAHRHLIDRLGAEGYAIIALNQLGYGDNPAYANVAPHGQVNVHFEMSKLDHAMRFHIEPTIAAINLAVDKLGYAYVDMIGFSSGALNTVIAAAIDPRIRGSYPIAGVYPIYLREGQEILANGPPYFPPMLAAIGYLDMFVLGAYGGQGRRQLQIFNRYDRCCFRNTKGRLYEQAVNERAALLSGGGFGVYIDETHADHKISSAAIGRLIEDLRRP